MCKDLGRSTAVRMLLSTIPGENVNREGLLDTPGRVERMYDELFEGYQMNPEEILSRTFDVPDANAGIVLVKDIHFYSQCEHHMVPFFGKVNIAYIPGERVVGLSKFARLVECYARRLQVQERMTGQIIDDIVKYLKPKAAMVVIEAEHMCMTMRGIQKPGTKTTTSRVYGAFAEKSDARMEVLKLMEA